MIGQVLSHYRILEKTGEGGMGVVYKARDRHLDRLVALKILPPDRVADPDRKRRFVQEAKAASALNHPNIITIYDIDSSEGVDFIAMEYVEGRTLRQVIGSNGLELETAIKYATVLSGAIAAAHKAGIVHRDLKPANIMISEQGHLKVLDFGLAKLTEPSAPAAEAQTLAATAGEPSITREGAIVGTVAYMSPEQIEGRKIDARSDVFSFGAVFYEILTGQQAFHGDSIISTMSSILRDTPSPARALRADIPHDVERVLGRCLEKDRESRYASAVELHEDLLACLDRLAVRKISTVSLLRRPRFAVASLTLVAAIAGVLGWLWWRNSRANWAATTALAEIARLAENRQYPQGFQLAMQAGQYIPSDRRLADLLNQVSIAVSVQTNVPGADVWYKEYAAADSEWSHLGRSPIKDVRVPMGLKRWRIAKEGYQDIEAAISPELDGASMKFVLDSAGGIPRDMVRVSGGGAVFLFLTGLDHLAVPALDDFLIDRYEVSNKQFAEFVSAGGYRKSEYWKHPIEREGRVLSWSEAMALFRDSTGRPGPAGWELGDPAAGQGDLPVTGVSWYEAAAYAEYAGKHLPSIYHWNRAAWTTAGFRDISPVIRLSNFSGQALAPAGKYSGMNPYGTYDLAGNAKEWCWNAADAGGSRRYILGGAWNEPAYMFNDPDAQSPLSRQPNYGIRCVKFLSAVPPQVLEPADTARRDYSREKPATAEAFRIYRNFYAYDKTRLDPIIESTDASPEHWKVQKLSFKAAYGGERVTAYLYLPRGVEPPYQTVIYFPGSNTLRTRSFASAVQAVPFDFIVRGGRAVLFPVYKSTFERGDGLLSDRPNLTNGYRDHVVQWYKDFARSIDYLETRKDIDSRKLGYFGYSWGATMGPILLALDDRCGAAVWSLGGLWQQKGPPEVEPINFLPRVKIPVLMLNGRYDFVFPVDASQAPMFQSLGSSIKDKRHLFFESGHSVPRKELITETLRWFDQRLGTVK